MSLHINCINTQGMFWVTRLFVVSAETVYIMLAALWFRTEPIFYETTMSTTLTKLLFLLQRMNRCPLCERGRRWLLCLLQGLTGHFRASAGLDGQTVGPSSLHLAGTALSPSSVMVSSPCPALKHHGGFRCPAC